MTSIRIAAGIGVTVIALYWMARRDAKARAVKLKEVFAGRDALSPEAFYFQYFKDAGIPVHVAATVRKILEDQLGADMSRLSAEDCFTTNLRFLLDADSMADVAILVALEKEFGIKISDAESENTRTIRDLVELVASKTGFTQ